jgi:hypothetical protein
MHVRVIKKPLESAEYAEDRSSKNKMSKKETEGIMEIEEKPQNSNLHVLRSKLLLWMDESAFFTFIALAQLIELAWDDLVRTSLVLAALVTATRLGAVVGSLPFASPAAMLAMLLGIQGGVHGSHVWLLLLRHRRESGPVWHTRWRRWKRCTARLCELLLGHG